jgi:outer membrane protein TolC
MAHHECYSSKNDFFGKKYMKLVTVGGCLLVFCTSFVQGKIVFEREKIYEFLNHNNPYVATIIAKQKIQDAKLVYTQGEFDTKLGAKYDEKQYPMSDGRLSDIYVEQPIENGMDLLLGYRQAQGVQEYNNIKTGDRGEMRIGLKAPIMPLLQGTNQRKASLRFASLGSKESHAQMLKSLRELHLGVLGNYYELLFQHELLGLEKALLEKAHQQYKLIQKRVLVGDEAPILLVEAQQLVNEREQRLTESKNRFGVVREKLINYLNITQKEFEELFELPKLPSVPISELETQVQIEKIVKNRPDIQILEYEKEKLYEETQLAELLRYPQLEASVVGVHDRVYDSGFKVSLDIAFAPERRKYEGKRLEIQSQKDKNFNETKKNLLEANRDAMINIETTRALKENYSNALKEVALAEQLEKAEARKFELGQSELFVLNQREMKTLQVRQKIAHYHVKILMNMLEMEIDTGELDHNF